MTAELTSVQELVTQVNHGLSYGEGLGDELQTIRSIYGFETAVQVEEIVTEEEAK